MSSLTEKQPLLLSPDQRQPYVLVIHGGAGTILREGSTPEVQAAYKASLRAALEAVQRLFIISICPAHSP